jgi:hypothetical protein
LQIGLWNVNEKRRLPFVNWWFKKNRNVKNESMLSIRLFIIEYYINLCIAALSRRNNALSRLQNPWVCKSTAWNQQHSF